MARFLVDADMPARTAEVLRANGYDAVDVRELGLGSALDPAIFDHAQSERRALISRDLGFGGLAAGHPSHHGMILLRFGNLRSPAIIDGILAALTSLGADTGNLSGTVIAVEPGRIRTRRLP